MAPAPLNGILKGGKLWRGGNAASQAGNAAGSSSSAAAAGGSDGMVRMEKAPAVRFIHLNDTQAEDEEEEAARCGVANSAFQQLFPRARKLMQVTVSLWMNSIEFNWIQFYEFIIIIIIIY